MNLTTPKITQPYRIDLRQREKGHYSYTLYLPDYLKQWEKCINIFVLSDPGREVVPPSLHRSKTHGFKTVHNLELAPHANMKWSCLLWLSVIRDKIVFLFVY